MKKFFSFIFLSAVLILTSCQSSSESSLTITFWHYYHGVQQTALDNLIHEYNTTEGLSKGITVEAVSYGGVNDLSEAVLSSASDKSNEHPMPDLFSSYRDSAYNLARLNKLADLNNYFSSEDLEIYIDYYIEDGRFSSGELYVFPIAKATDVFMLNKTGWDKFQNEVNADPNFNSVSLDMLESWEGVLEAAEIYYNWTDSKTSVPNDGKALFGMDYPANFFYAGAVQLGYEFFSEPEFNRDIMKKLWDYYYVPKIKGYYGSYGRFRSDDVKTGDLLCFTGSTSSAAYFPLEVANSDEENYNIEVYISQFPTFAGTEKTVMLQGAGICVAKSNEQHEKAAAEFLKWFTEPERNLNFNINAAGYFPVTDEAMEKLNSITNEATPSDGAEKVLNEVYKTTVKQINEYRLYSAPATDAASKLRSDFNSLKAKAENERADIAGIDDTEEYEAAVAAAVSEESFEEWFKTIT